MKRIFAIILLILMAAYAFAQQPASNLDPASREQILKMMEVMDARNQAKNLMGTMQQQVGAMMNEQLEKSAPNAPPEARAEMTAAMQEMLKDMEPIMSEMIDSMVPIYQKYLSRSEADAIIAFYQSPEGQSFLHKMPLIMGEAMPQMMKSMNSKMQPALEKLTKRMEEIVKKYPDAAHGAHGSSSGPAPDPTPVSSK